MRKQIALLLTIGVIVTASSCGVRPETQKEEKNSMHSVAATSTEENHLAVMEALAIFTPTPTPTVETEVPVTVTPSTTATCIPDSAAPSQMPIATPEPVPTSAAPLALATTSEPVPLQAPEPIPEHIHEWVPVTETVRHEALVEEVKVVDAPATEGHFEGGSYPVMVCRCGAEFTSGDAWEAHAIEMGRGHGGFTDSWRSNQVWVEGTPEVFHYEAVTVQDAWDEEIILEYRCSCGAVR